MVLHVQRRHPVEVTHGLLQADRGRVSVRAETLYLVVEEERVEDGVLAPVTGVHHRSAVTGAAADLGSSGCLPALFGDQRGGRLDQPPVGDLDALGLRQPACWRRHSCILDARQLTYLFSVNFRRAVWHSRRDGAVADRGAGTAGRRRARRADRAGQRILVSAVSTPSDRGRPARDRDREIARPVGGARCDGIAGRLSPRVGFLSTGRGTRADADTARLHRADRRRHGRFRAVDGRSRALGQRRSPRRPFDGSGPHLHRRAGGSSRLVDGQCRCAGGVPEHRHPDRARPAGARVRAGVAGLSREVVGTCARGGRRVRRASSPSVRSRHCLR